MAKNKIRVCCGMTCAITGAKRIMRNLENATGLKAGESNAENDLNYCGCTGYCHMAPNVVVNDNYLHHANEETIVNDVKDMKSKPPGTEKAPEATAEDILNMDFLGDI